MTTTARIELKDLEIQTQIGTYAPGAVIPKQHLLDLTLWIEPQLVLISEDVMENVFDYDPLMVEIDQLAADGHYETQERLMSRIIQACTKYPEIESLEIGLRKLPVRAGTGSLGVRLFVNQETLASLRASSALS
ncbi:dihydroneopterin aldolase [Polynucleobacter sp. 15G-AUS-farblos]|uniref:dihydroneopterin aldolase n=1 Tax=Polynucleobacter sp. 15G-AUS-farblos TaxID=2689094 RepID=UPI001C0B4BC9|nr:dihydroneopterin aldolase [Polynucleobacter sp. 15G-AUS-farblos]MBU3584265.1 dihydroneopterin aldolase [Polynucleobacter sp. 15G-AUS-farblos]